MADLLDIAPATAVEVVKIGNKRVTVRGISFGTIASIVARFPQLRSIGSGGGDMVTKLIAGCGEAVGPIIAAGCGHLNDEQYEQRAAELLPEHQLKFIKAIFWLTFPNGLGSFLTTISELMGGAEEKQIRVRLKSSPLTSQPSSELASRPSMQ